MSLHPDFWATPTPIAHRGSRFLWPENTMESFSGAYELGFRHFETDLHMTSDRVLVCHHDATVDRTTNARGSVSSFTYREIRGLDAGHRHSAPDGFPHRGNGVRIPSFEEVVASFPDASFVVDLKADGMIETFAQLIDRLGIHHRLIVGAFSDGRLEAFRAATAGRVAVSTGPMLSRIWVLASRVGRGGGGFASALQLPTRMRGVTVVDDRLVLAAHRRGLQVHAWTVNEPDEMGRLLDMGVDGLVTDRPDLLKRVLEERGAWLTR